MKYSHRQIRRRILLQVLKPHLDWLREGVQPANVAPVEHAACLLVLRAFEIPLPLAFLDGLADVLGELGEQTPAPLCVQRNAGRRAC